ncbi:MAG: zinc ribbon domain-containing protein [Phocaeicola sp.]|uniref:zinc ribbon domain-containing protein n=1 Tax=Phocaeicola sp. TaxID=2773926 RepID=UPI003FA0D8F7
MVKEVKKDPNELTVEEKLAALYQLQTILTEVDKIKTLRGELPLEVQDLEDEVVGLKTRIENFKNEVDELKADIANRKHNIEAANALIAKYTEQQDNVRNNREYETLSKEIEYKNLEIELDQKRIREGMDVINNRTEEIAENQVEVEERSKDLEAKKEELDSIVAETKQQEEKLREKAKALEINIEPRLLQAFKRIRKNCRNGLGIVTVQRDACGGCFNKIPPQKQLDIRMRKKIIVCEYCGRIMIDPELAGVVEEVPATPVKKRRASKKVASKEPKAKAAPKVETPDVDMEDVEA